jgi:hypothetical protein
LEVTGWAECSVSVVIWAKVDATAATGIIFTIVEASSISIDSDRMGTGSHSYCVEALGWKLSETLWVSKYSEALSEAVFADDGRVK